MRKCFPLTHWLARFVLTERGTSISTAYEMPVFSEAAREFSGFLVSQGVSAELLWVFREDVCWYRQRLLVKVPVPEENTSIVQALYERGVERGLGVRLEVLCVLAGRPCCYIWLPADEEDASYAMLTGLKMGLPIRPIVAQPVNNGLRWRICKWLESRERFKGMVAELPRRAS